MTNRDEEIVKQKECLCKNIFDRMCEDCGLFVEPLEMARGWNLQNTSIKNIESEKSKLIKHLVNDLRIPFKLVNDCSNQVDKVSMIRNTTLKGRRKKSLMFACIFAKTRKDPEELCRMFSLSHHECRRGVELFETHLGYINWHWKELLKCKLTSIKKEEYFDRVCESYLSTRSKGKINIGLAKCVSNICNIDKEDAYKLFNCL